MPRRVPSDRLYEVARCACLCFSQKGYTRTLLTDVAAELGFSHALLYHYVESKEALFFLALLFAMDPDTIDDLELPIATPLPEERLAPVRAWLAERAEPVALTQALRYKRSRDIEKELLDIIDEIYNFTQQNQMLLGLIEPSSFDIPELYELYITGFRRHIFELVRKYLKQRVKSGDLDEMPDLQAGVEFIMEVVNWFASQRKKDVDPVAVDEDHLRTSVHQFVSKALLPRGAAAV